MGGKHSKQEHDHHHHLSGHHHKAEIIPPRTTAEKVLTSTEATTTTTKLEQPIMTSTAPTTTIPAGVVSSAENIRTVHATNFNLQPNTQTYTSEVLPTTTVVGEVISHSTQGIPAGAIIESTTSSINQPQGSGTETYYK